jgi:hypothetical protein
MAPPRRRRRAISHIEAWEKIEKASNRITVPTRGARSTPFTPATSDCTQKKKRIFETRLLEVRKRCDPNSDNAERLVCKALKQTHVVDMNRNEWSLFLDKMGNERGGPVLRWKPALRYDFASSKGIEAVFRKQICDTIRKGSIRADGKGILTAAVTMIFPQFVEGTCTLIINISKGAFELAKALFKTTITRGTQVYHFMVDDGPSLTMPLVEFTLGDAKKDAVKEIFVPQVYAAITNDLNSDQDTAVSMIIKEESARIEIFLNPWRGCDLAKVLYS